jgi:hypothetical protein
LGWELLRVMGVLSRSWAHVRTSVLALVLMLSCSRIPELSFCDIILCHVSGVVYTFVSNAGHTVDIIYHSPIISEKQ